MFHPYTTTRLPMLPPYKMEFRLEIEHFPIDVFASQRQFEIGFYNPPPEIGVKHFISLKSVNFVLFIDFFRNFSSVTLKRPNF